MWSKCMTSAQHTTLSASLQLFTHQRYEWQSNETPHGNLLPQAVSMRKDWQKGSGCHPHECTQIVVCHPKFAVSNFQQQSPGTLFPSVGCTKYSDAHQRTSLSSLPQTTAVAAILKHLALQGNPLGRRVTPILPCPPPPLVFPLMYSLTLYLLLLPLALPLPLAFSFWTYVPVDDLNKIILCRKLPTVSTAHIWRTR